MKINKNYVVLLTFLLLSGCTEKSKDSNSNTGLNNNRNQNNTKAEVNIITSSQLDSIIQNRFGKILFVNVWATWAEPSVKEMPDIKLLYEKYKDQDVDFLSLSVDLTSKIDSVVIPFIEKEKINFPVKVVEEKSGMQVMKLLSPKWNGAVPASFLFDKNGRREIFIIGRQTLVNLSKGIDSVRVL